MLRSTIFYLVLGYPCLQFAVCGRDGLKIDLSFDKEEMILQGSFGRGRFRKGGISRVVNNSQETLALVEHEFFGRLVLDLERSAVVDRISRKCGEVVGFDNDNNIVVKYRNNDKDKHRLWSVATRSWISN